MEHASRGRRSGNKGVGARWRGRFRIFSARHRSRTEVSHAENSGMTTIFLTSSVSPTPPPADWGGRIRCAGRPREWSCGAVPPQERWHEGLGLFFGLGGSFTRSGVVRHACRHRVTARGAFDFFDVLGGAEGCCGSMCWPQERPATHAAAGAAARGVLVFRFGGFFHTLGSGWHERVRGGGFNPLRGATTGVVMRRRATSGEMARGGLVFVFFFGGCSGVGGGFFHTPGSDCTRNLGF